MKIHKIRVEHDLNILDEIYMKYAIRGQHVRRYWMHRNADETKMAT